MRTLKNNTAIEVELDEMWSFCQNKKKQLWLWWAIDHNNKTPLAFTFGTREYKNLYNLLALLQPFNIKTFFTDNYFAYSKIIPKDTLIIGKKNTQNIERFHLTLRTRIKRLSRKTICFSKNTDIHISVISSFIIKFLFPYTSSFSTT